MSDKKRKKKFYLIFLLVTFFLSGTGLNTSGFFSDKKEIVNPDCTINKIVFERVWQKYADINDDRVSSQSKSWEAQQYHRAAEQYIQIRAGQYRLQCVMAVHAKMRRDTREIRRLLVRNIKQNLLKSFMRLSYFTYTTIKDAAGLGSSFTNLFKEGISKSVKLASAVKVVRHYIPKKSRLALNDKKVSGKLTSFGLSSALEFVENFDDPNEIAEAITKEFNNNIYPSVTLSKKEIKLLANQKELLDLFDQRLADSYAFSKKWLKKTEAMKIRLAGLRSEMAKWHRQEKNRIKDMFVQQCLKNKKREMDPVGSVKISGSWNWTATCGTTKFTGTFTISTPDKNDRIRGSFSNSHHGTLTGTFVGNHLNFTRALPDGRIQVWAGNLGKNGKISGSVSDKDHAKMKLTTTCSFTAKR